MIFNTPWFLGFFAAFFAALWVVPGGKPRFYFLLAASAVFHAHFAGPAGVAPIIVMAVAVFIIARRLERSAGPARRAWFVAGLLVPVLGLTYYKYRVFLVGSLLGAVPAWAGPLGFLAAPGPLPLAISFFTFEFVHYLVEIWHGRPSIQSPARFALFCIYFPSIVSGPIKRYEKFNAQVEVGIPHPLENGRVLEGLSRVLTGFFKKLVVADNVTAFIGLMEKQAHWGPPQVLLLLLMLSVRILFDFSGYSDIAIGLSRMIGLDLPENFNYPYLALNPSDFWRRWHMSLSTWIRDYLYIPLGGSRQGLARKGFNGLLAMAICGLWHGAAWNFAVWGLYHGAGLALHSMYRGRSKPAPTPGPLSRGLAWAGCMAFVAYGWLIFFYPLDKVWFYTRSLFGAHG